MKSSMLCFTLLLFGSLAFSQTSAHVEIITPEKLQKPLLLAENSMLIMSFNSQEYSLEMTRTLNNSSLSSVNTERMRRGLLVFSPKALKRTAYENFKMNYNRLELKRLLPGPPSFDNFCPQVYN